MNFKNYCLFAVLGGFLLAAAAAAADTAVPGGFEKWVECSDSSPDRAVLTGNLVPDGWSIHGKTVSASRDTAIKAEGDASLRIVCGDMDSASIFRFPVVVKGNVTYRFSCRIKAENFAPATRDFIWIGLQSGPEGKLFWSEKKGKLSIVRRTGTFDWIECSDTWTTRPTDVCAMLRVSIPKGRGTVWVDDFRLQEVGNRGGAESPAPANAAPVTGIVAPSPDRTSASSTSASITVGWNLYPLAAKLCREYAKTDGGQAPLLKLSNTPCAEKSGRAPDGSPTLGYITMAPAVVPEGMEVTPLCDKGFLFYANRSNPFLDRLAGHEIPFPMLAKLYAREVTWEELAGIAGQGDTPVRAVAPDRDFLALIGAPGNPGPGTMLKSGEPGLAEASGSRYVLGACTLDFVLDEIIGRGGADFPSLVPLRFIRLENGNFRLEPFGTSGGMGTRLLYEQFGGIVLAGEFLRYPVVLQSRSSSGLGKALAAAAVRTGMRELLKFNSYPLKVEYPQKQPNRQKFVFAHAMQCFLLGGIPTGFAGSYPADVKSEDFAAWPPEAVPGTRIWWSERLSPYVHKPEPASTRMTLDSAEAAGIDALGLLIYPGCLSENNPWHRGLVLMIEAAQKHKEKVLFDLWGTFPPDWSAEAKSEYGARFGRELKAVMDRYPDAFLHVDGKPALSFGRDMVKPGQSASDYNSFFAALGGRDRFFLICDLLPEPAHNFFRGWEALGDISTVWFVNSGWGDRGAYDILMPLKARGEKTCWPVSPGYYRANFGGNSNAGCVTEGYGACKLIDDWREAIQTGAGGVEVQSWNDLGEDHCILESNFRGGSYIRICRYFSDWFHRGVAPEIKEEKLFLFHRRHLKDAQLEQNTGRLAENPSWCSAPVTDYVHIVTMLKKPADVRVKLGGQIFTLEQVQPGVREWLLLVPVEKNHGGNEPFWNQGSYRQTHPVDTPFRKVTELKKLNACVPEAEVIRNGGTVLKVVSKTGLPDRFKFQTLNVVGSENQ